MFVLLTRDVDDSDRLLLFVRVADVDAVDVVVSESLDNLANRRAAQHVHDLKKEAGQILGAISGQHRCRLGSAQISSVASAQLASESQSGAVL